MRSEEVREGCRGEGVRGSRGEGVQEVQEKVTE